MPETFLGVETKVELFSRGRPRHKRARAKPGSLRTVIRGKCQAVDTSLMVPGPKIVAYTFITNIVNLEGESNLAQLCELSPQFVAPAVGKAGRFCRDPVVARSLGSIAQIKNLIDVIARMMPRGPNQLRGCRREAWEIACKMKLLELKRAGEPVPSHPRIPAHPLSSSPSPTKD